MQDVIVGWGKDTSIYLDVILWICNQLVFLSFLRSTIKSKICRCNDRNNCNSSKRTALGTPKIMFSTPEGAIEMKPCYIQKGLAIKQVCSEGNS